MAFLEENNFCSIEDYYRHRENRLQNTTLEVNGLYTAMMRLDNTEREAAKFAVRVEKVANYAAIISVQFSFLNEKLEAEHTGGAFVRPDGIIPYFVNTLITDPSTSKAFKIRESYLRDYFDDQFGCMLEQTTSLSVRT